MKEPTNYLPKPDLLEYIASYGVLEIPEGVKEPYFSPPLGLSGFILQMIDTDKIVTAKIAGEVFFSGLAVVTGQVTAPVYGEFTGPLKSILIFFQPLGIHRLFGTDMSTLTNKSVSLENFIGKERADQLMQKLKADQNPNHQIEVLNDFFSDIVPVVNNVYGFDRVLEFIHKNQGRVSVREIEAYIHLHRRTLERQFNKMVGLPPKVYTQIYQFKCLINLIQSYPGITWTQLATQAGYYDQSHMSRYFKEYLKVSPNSMVNLDMEFINYLLER